MKPGWRYYAGMALVGGPTGAMVGMLTGGGFDGAAGALVIAALAVPVVGGGLLVIADRDRRLEIEAEVPAE